MAAESMSGQRGVLQLWREAALQPPTAAFWVGSICPDPGFGSGGLGLGLPGLRWRKTHFCWVLF